MNGDGSGKRNVISISIRAEPLTRNSCSIQKVCSVYVIRVRSINVACVLVYVLQPMTIFRANDNEKCTRTGELLLV